MIGQVPTETNNVHTFEADNAMYGVSRFIMTVRSGLMDGKYWRVDIKRQKTSIEYKILLKLGTSNPLKHKIGPKATSQTSGGSELL